MGIVVNATKPHEFDFIAKRSIRIGEFVTLKIEDKDVLGFVKNSIVRSKIFNEDIITHYQTAFEAVKIANTDSRDKGRFASISVIGFIDELINNKVTKPSIPPDPGTEIYEADDETLKKIFKRESKEWVKVGKLLRAQSVDVYVNINKMASRHLAILAITGSGKSNLLALIMKHVAQLHGTMIIFDYHGEYLDVKIDNVRPVQPKINPKMLDAEEFADIIGIREDADKQRALLAKIFNEAKKSTDFWQELLDQLKEIQYSEDKKSKDKDLAYRVEEIINRARNSLKDILDENIGSLDQIKENKINIFNMIELNEKQASIIIAYYLEKILSNKKNKNTLASPLIVAIEEAHAFIPQGDKSKVSDVVAKVAREGRKFGVGLIIISQRPSKIDQNVLSQMNSFAISRIIQPKDQNYIMDATADISTELLQHLSALNVGEMLLTGQWITIPSLVKIDEIKEKFAGSDINAVDEWSKNFENKRKGESTAEMIRND